MPLPFSLPSATVVAKRYCFHNRVSRILSTGGGVYPVACYDTHTSRADTPQADTHTQTDSPRQTPLGRHPLDRHPLGRHSPMQKTHPTPTPEMATAADGRHPTAMHSCDLLFQVPTRGTATEISRIRVRFDKKANSTNLMLSKSSLSGVGSPTICMFKFTESLRKV